MITLQFSTTSRPASRLICWGTWGRHSHVDLVLPDGQLLGAVPGGVQVRPFDPSALRIERHQVDAPDTVLERAISQQGRPYDWPGVLGYALRRDWQEDDSWFCSELVAWAFQDAGRPLLRAGDAWRITPRDLLLSPLLSEV